MQKKTNPMWLVGLIWLGGVLLFFLTQWPDPKPVTFYLMLVVLVLGLPAVFLGIYTMIFFEEMKKKFVKEEDSEAKKKKFVVSFCALGALVVALVAVGGFALYQEITLNGPVRKADALLEAGEYSEAIRAYMKIESDGWDRDEKIGNVYAAEAKALLEQSDVNGAVEVLSDGLKHYPVIRTQAAEMLHENAELYQAFFEAGTMLPIGRSLSDSAEACIWGVLERKDDCIFVIAPWNVLNRRTNNIQDEEERFGGDLKIGWEDSYLRKLLNKYESEFFDSTDASGVHSTDGSLYWRMFTDKERAAIQLTTVENVTYLNGELVKCADTQDHLFVLSKEEVERYRQDSRTADLFEDDSGLHEWWTRTPAQPDGDEGEMDHIYVFDPSHEGEEAFLAWYSNYDAQFMPAMWVNIDQLLQTWK